MNGPDLFGRVERNVVPSRFGCAKATTAPHNLLPSKVTSLESKSPKLKKWHHDGQISPLRKTRTKVITNPTSLKMIAPPARHCQHKPHHLEIWVGGEMWLKEALPERRVIIRMKIQVLDQTVGIGLNLSSSNNSSSAIIHHHEETGSRRPRSQWLISSAASQLPLRGVRVGCR